MVHIVANSLKSNDKLCKVKSTLQYCLKLTSRCKYEPKIGDISYSRSTKMGTHYLDFEPGNEL